MTVRVELMKWLEKILVGNNAMTVNVFSWFLKDVKIIRHVLIIFELSGFYKKNRLEEEHFIYFD